MFEKQINIVTKALEKLLSSALIVTQHMLQRRPNGMELRSMDSYIQTLRRFQKCRQKVPPPLLLSNEKSPFKDEKNLHN